MTMDHQPSRRTRSPVFDPRTMNDRDFDGSYNTFEGLSRQHPMPAIGGIDFAHGPEPSDRFGLPFMVQPQGHGYSANYRDNRLPSTYRQTMREPYPVAAPPSRSSSPSYKILCITNINHKIDDLSVKHALMSDFSRYGSISVSICHDSGERLAYIYFRTYEEAREARIAKTRTIFFDRPIEIEPIFELNGSPVEGASPPPSYPQAMVPQQPSIYSPRSRRSMTPAEYPYEMNGPPSSHRRPVIPPQLHHHALTPPIPRSDKPLSPSGYPQLHATGYGSHGPSPPPIESSSIPPVYDRRENYGGQYIASSHMSPYSSPPHEPCRSSYVPGNHYSPSQYSGNGPPPPSTSRSDRERLYVDDRYVKSRSPHISDPYYHPETRGPPVPPPHAYHSSARPSGHHSASPGGHPLNRPGPYNPQGLPTAYRTRPSAASPPHPYSPHSYGRHDPPMRFMSREYRRERYGINDPHGGEHEDGRPSRVLLVNNIDSNKTESTLRDMFEPFGIIEELEIKKVNPEISSALIRFSSMDGAYKAKTANHGRYIGNSKCSIVYGKVSASKRLWIGGLSSSTTVRSLEDECSRYGDLVSMEYTSGRPYSYVEFENPNQAQFAAYHLRTKLYPAPDRKIRIEFVDPERSEKMSRHDANLQATEARSRMANESWTSNERETSLSSMIGRKRSISPTELSTKRLCPVNDLPPRSNTFKHERLAAAAAAKARSSSTASPVVEKTSESSVNLVESDNNTSNQSKNGNLVSDTSQTPSEDTNDGELQYETPSLDMLLQCSKVREIVTCCPVSWPCHMALRNFIFPCRIHLYSGSKQIVEQYLAKTVDVAEKQSSCPLLRITQRWRLHPQPKLEEVKKRMLVGNLGMLIITSRQEVLVTNIGGGSRSSLSKSDFSSKIQQKILQNGEGGSDTTKLLTSATEQNSQTQSSPDKTDADNDDVTNKSASANNVSVGGESAAPVNPDDASQQNSLQTQTALPSNAQSRPLRNLISYLEQKDAAGVISLSAPDANTTAGEQAGVGASGRSLDGSSKLLYTFPPGEFALNLIKHMASNLSTEVSREEFLLGVITGANVEGKL